MNGYLVLFRAVLDDLPLGLFEDNQEARKFAASVADKYNSNPEKMPDECLEVMGVLGLDTSSGVCINVLHSHRGRIVCLVATFKLGS